MTFGTFRFILACFVVMSHILHKETPNIGFYAVSGFFILSGFLMTLILNETYGFSFQGLRKYTVNRALRIYPIYFLVLFITFFLFVLFESLEATGSFLNPSLLIPHSLLSWIHNIFIIGLGSYFVSGRELFRLVPTAWALHNELIFYLLIPFIGRSFRAALIWLGVSLAILVYFLVVNAEWGTRYNTLLGSSLPFSLGCTLYYLKVNKFRPLSILQSRMAFLILIPVAIVSYFLSEIMSLFSILVNGKGFPYYLNMACNFCIVVNLINIKLENKFWKKTDKFLGDLSYPVYLIHWICAALVVWLLAKISVDVQKESLELLLYSSVLIILFSVLIAKLFDEKINTLREKVKSVHK